MPLARALAHRDGCVYRDVPIERIGRGRARRGVVHGRRVRRARRDRFAEVIDGWAGTPDVLSSGGSAIITPFGDYLAGLPFVPLIVNEQPTAPVEAAN